MALSPLHETGVPLAAAVIPPQLPDNRCALTRTLPYSPPLGPIAPRGGRARCFCSGTRLARVVVPAEGGGGLRPLEPPISRAKPAAAESCSAMRLVIYWRAFGLQTVYPRRQALRAPLFASLPSAACSAQTGSRWGRSNRVKRRAWNSAEGSVEPDNAKRWRCPTC